MNFFELTALTALELSGNMISELPVGVLLLTNLTVLKAPGNSLVHLVESGNLSPLSRLVLLNVKDNRISMVEESFSNLVHLKELNIRQNNVHAVIPGIRHCREMIKLNLAQNNLEFLCKEIFRIPELEYLDVSHNTICVLPNAICFAVNIKELDLSYNRLQLLPTEFGNLEMLRYGGLIYESLCGLIIYPYRLLNLNQNMLRELPASFKRCTALKQDSAFRGQIESVLFRAYNYLLYSVISEQQQALSFAT